RCRGNRIGGDGGRRPRPVREGPRVSSGKDREPGKGHSMSPADNPADPNGRQRPADAPAPPDPWKGLRGVMAGTLVLESIVVLLALPIVADVGGGLTWVSGGYLVGLAVLMIRGAACWRAPWSWSPSWWGRTCRSGPMSAAGARGWRAAIWWAWRC